MAWDDHDIDVRDADSLEYHDIFTRSGKGEPKYKQWQRLADAAKANGNNAEAAKFRDRYVLFRFSFD